MLTNMCHGGKIAMLGIPADEMAIDWNTVVFNMLTIKGIYGREMYETWYKMTVMLQSGLDISPVITHRFHYTEFEQGFEVMMSGKSGKVILQLGTNSVQRMIEASSHEKRNDGSTIESTLRISLTTIRELDCTRPNASLRRRKMPHSRWRDGRAGAQHVRQQLPGTGRTSRGDRGRARRPRPLGLRTVFGAVHLRHASDPQAAGEASISEFLGTEDTILYTSCFDANGGLFETLLGPEDAVISDELNHASIIDGIRLCKAQRYPLPEQRHGRPRSEAAGGRVGTVSADRHRRRVLHGRLHRQPARHLRPGR